MQLQCSSCKTAIANQSGAAQFKCPGCGKTDIIRCRHCRQIGAKYHCHECSFEGPN